MGGSGLTNALHQGAVAEGIQHCLATQLAGLPAADVCRDKPETEGVGTGGGYAVNCVNELGRKNPAKPPPNFFIYRT